MRERREVRIGAHVSDDAGDDRGLARLVLANRGVLGEHMRHLVAQHGGEFGGVAGERDQPARHVKLAARQRKGVHRAGVEDGDLVALIGTIGCGDQAVDRLADQRFELRVVIGAAIGCQYPLMFALGGRRVRDHRLGFGRRRGGRRCHLETAHVAAGGQQKREAKRSQRRPKAAAHCRIAPSRKSTHSRLLALPRFQIASGSVPAQHFNLLHPNHVNPRAGARLDPAPNPNPSILQGLKDDPGRCEGRRYAP